MASPASRIRVYTFSALWEKLPAGGPFDLKLLSWLSLAGIPYEQVFQDDTRKGPKRKNPWVELDGVPIGDTEIIIDLLSRQFDVDLDEGLTPEQKAIGHAWRRGFEEHFHQVLEWELFVHPAGAAFIKAGMEKTMPPVIGRIVFKMMQRQMRLQLYARGIARHAPEMIEQKGRADIDALSAFLGDKPFLLTDRPVLADTAVFGLLAPMVYWPMATPVAQYARNVPNIMAYCDRMRTHCFERVNKAAA
jgi:glutathione S-transferase